ncbi:T9SS type A sorting domain-containing protein [candidate division KSB1 bacterium]|nr:T9SS type A sorting domain-containing protein [candidate division KSB1 bacterium]
MIKLHGVTSVSAPAVPEGPRGFRLEANFPNPCNAGTRIVYELPANLRVRLELFNMNGQRLAVLVDDFKAAGKHSVDFDAAGLASGTYVYRLSTSQTTLTRKLALVR